MTNIFYKNTRLLILTICLIVVWGVSSFQGLPRQEDPELSNRWALINTSFPGANAYLVESLVTEKIETELTEIEEIETIRSTSRPGMSTVTVDMSQANIDVERVASRIRDRLSDVRPQLPPGASEPVYEQLLPGVAQSLIVGLSWEWSESPNYIILRRLAEELAENFRAIPGTDRVEFEGLPQEEMVVEIEPGELANLDLTVQDLAEQIRLSDAKIAAGQLKSDRNDIQLEVKGELKSAENIRQIPIQFGNLGQSVFLGDIATVKKGILQPQTEETLINGKPGLAIAVLMDSDLRIDRWAARARKTLREFEANLPSGIALQTIFDQSSYVETRLNSLFFNLLLSTLFVVGSSFLMMGGRAAVAIGCTLPLSTLMIFGGMNLLQIPMHQMSITGLVIALGLLIDNAIVVVDEINHKLERGLKAHRAISATVSYLTVPLLASTLTTILTFLPVALMTGSIGEFVRDIALSAILALISSFFLALTIVPALTGKLATLRFFAPAGGNSWWQKGISSRHLALVYRQLIRRILRRPIWGVVLALIIPISGFSLAGSLEEQFFPPAERDQFQIEFELTPSASLAETEASVLRLDERLKQHSEITDTYWFVGGNAPKFYYNLRANIQDLSNYAQGVVQLTPDTSSKEIIQDLQSEVNLAFPEARVLMRQLEQGPPIDAPIELRILGSDIDTIRELSEKIRFEIAQVPDVVYSKSTLTDTIAKLEVNLDESGVRLLGLDKTAIAQELDAGLTGSVSGSILEDTEELILKVRLADEERGNLDDISSLKLTPNRRDGNTNPIPLEALGKIELAPELAVITRRDRQRVDNIRVFITAGVLPAQVLTHIKQRLESGALKLPLGYTLEFGGEAAERNDAVGKLASSLSIIFVLIVAALVLSFSSFRLAAIIIIVGISSIGLGLFSLWLFNYPFGFMAILGTVCLVGIAINDSIVVLTAIHADAAAKAGDRQAIQEILVDSTRHVLTTSITTIVGFLPLLIEGGEFWPPLAICIAGGVAGATLLALSFVPCAYLLLNKQDQYYASDTSLQYVNVDEEFSWN
ncbi:MAG: efflux RND transporter permease subunit [Cyanobacteria bacterium J06648_1]